MKPFLIILFFVCILTRCSNEIEAKLDLSTRQRASLKRSSNIKDRLTNTIVPSRTINESEKNVVKSKVFNPDNISSVRGGQIANTLPNAFIGSIVMALIEKLVKEGLQKSGIKFPAGLGACIILFSTLLMLDFVSPATATYIFQSLGPGSALLAKWLPVMFVPGLVMLPLSPPIGSTVDIIKVAGTIGIGFIYSLTTTIIGVTAIRKLTGQQAVAPPTTNITTKPKRSPKGPSSVAAAVPAKPFSDETWKLFSVGTVVSGILSIIATRSTFEYASLLQTVFLAFVTGGAYIWSARLPTAFVKLVHPLVTSSILILSTIRLLGLCTDVEFLDVLRAYKTGKLMPLHKTGAGDLLMYALGPSVVSFGIAMYSRKVLLAKNLVSVLVAMVIASVGGLFGTAFFVKLINLGGKNGAMVRLSMVARNITTALALPLTAMIGGDLSIAAAVVCMTGIIGASYGKSLLAYLGVTDPLLRGLAIGSSAQGLGVASLADEPDAFPFAAIAMVLTAVAGTTLAAIPSIQSAIIKTATG